MYVLDLFSGIGGFSLGLEQSGMETLAFCEFEPYAQKVLKKNWPNVPIHTDARLLDGKQFRGKANIICGGFPCQDISIGGKNAGFLGGEKTKLWTEFKRIIEEAQPEYALIENVNALLGRGLNIVLNDLASLGYDATYTTLDTKWCGLPQRRRRVYILAVRDGIAPDSDIFKFKERDTIGCRESMELVQQGFEWDFSKDGEGREGFTFLTCQRSDEYGEVGLSSALLKRDYKQFTDIVVYNDGSVRRVIPQERMLLQGFPSDWLENCDLSNTEKFMCNGMSVPVVNWIGDRLIEFDNSLTQP